MSTRISYLFTGLGHTGGSLVLYKFMDMLCEKGYEVHAITPSERIQWKAGFSNELLQGFQQGRRPGTGRAARRNSSSVWGRFQKKILKKQLGKTLANVKEQTDGLLKNWIPSEITVATFCTTCLVNYSLMDKTIPMYHMQHYEEFFLPDEKSQLLSRMTYFLPEILIANSTWLHGQIQNRVGRTPHLLTPGIDDRLFYPRVDIDQKYENMSKVSVISYYSPVKFKAWDDAVEAMSIVFQKAPLGKLEWIVYGGQPPSSTGLPIRFVGKVFGESLARLYSDSHICFMNSWFESFPLPPLEAMACGTAVVTTRYGTEDYAEHEINALVVPPRKPEELADRILELAGNPEKARRLARAGVETVPKHSWSRAGDRLAHIMDRAPYETTVGKFSDLKDLGEGRFPD